MFTVVGYIDTCPIMCLGYADNKYDAERMIDTYLCERYDYAEILGLWFNVERTT